MSTKKGRAKKPCRKTRGDRKRYYKNKNARLRKRRRRNRRYAVKRIAIENVSPKYTEP